ncbi:hypothetical protein C7427_103250 [Pantoea ananatis]|nr:hypothetical protein C7427_103250 [Pantoea ananatis]
MHPRFHSAFEVLPATLQTALRPVLSEPGFDAMLQADQVTL